MCQTIKACSDKKKKLYALIFTARNSFAFQHLYATSTFHISNSEPCHATTCYLYMLISILQPIINHSFESAHTHDLFLFLNFGLLWFLIQQIILICSCFCSDIKYHYHRAMVNACYYRVFQIQRFTYCIFPLCI